MKKTIIVTAIGSFSAQAVIETCHREGYRVVGCDIYSENWVVNSRDVDRFFQAPYATDRDRYKQFLRDVCRQEQADYILPLTDAEIDVFQEWPEAEKELGAVICMSGYEAVSLCRNKEKMEGFLTPLHICCPIPGESLLSVMEREAGSGYKNLSYPLVMKPVDGRSSQGLRVVESPKEMELAVELSRTRADRYLVQPRIDGRIVTVDTARDPESGKTACVARRELIRTHNGAGVSVYVFRSRELERQCHALADAIGIRGCVNFEFIENEDNEGRKQWHFLECNARFSGGVAFSCMAGYDMVKNHLNCFNGKGLEPVEKITEQYIARRYGEYRMGQA